MRPLITHGEQKGYTMESIGWVALSLAGLGVLLWSGGVLVCLLVAWLEGMESED